MISYKVHQYYPKMLRFHGQTASIIGGYSAKSIKDSIIFTADLDSWENFKLEKSNMMIGKMISSA